MRLSSGSQVRTLWEISVENKWGNSVHCSIQDDSRGWNHDTSRVVSKPAKLIGATPSLPPTRSRTFLSNKFGKLLLVIIYGEDKVLPALYGFCCTVLFQLALHLTCSELQRQTCYSVIAVSLASHFSIFLVLVHSNPKSQDSHRKGKCTTLGNGSRIANADTVRGSYTFHDLIGTLPVSTFNDTVTVGLSYESRRYVRLWIFTCGRAVSIWASWDSVDLTGRSPNEPSFPPRGNLLIPPDGMLLYWLSKIDDGSFSIWASSVEAGEAILISIALIWHSPMKILTVLYRGILQWVTRRCELAFYAGQKSKLLFVCDTLWYHYRKHCARSLVHDYSWPTPGYYNYTYPTHSTNSLRKPI